jgi:uncharacterized protein (TIGR02996 family)
MSADRDAFLRAVCDAPEDDTPRLVFADWLDEHGEAKRAEFIRVSCELEQVEEFGPRWRLLRDRAEKLLTPNRAKWSRVLADRKLLNVEFRRGFVNEVTVYSKRFVADADTLLALAPILRLKLADLTAARGNVPLDDVLACPAVVRLRGLDLANTPLPDPAIEQVAACGALGGLRELALDASELTGDACRALMRSGHLAGVTELTLAVRFDGNTFGNADGNALVGALASEPGLRRINRLTLRGCHVGPDGAKALAASRHAGGLQYLAISGGGYSAETRLGPKGIQALAGSENLSGLTALVVTGQEVGLRGVQALAESPRLAGLRHLDISGNPFTPAMVAALVGSPKLARHASLELRHCGVRDADQAGLRARFPYAIVANW